MNDAIKMQISAFVDGELPENEAQLLLRRLSQDKLLRKQAAEYIAVGRLLRGERGIAGMALLRDRVAAAIDDSSAAPGTDAAAAEAPRYIRPLLGLAIAATVALVGILGLQQTVGIGGSGSATSTAGVTVTPTDIGYTVPEPADDQLRENEQLREFYLRHSASSSPFGTSSINARLVTMQLREGMLVEADAVPGQPIDEDTSNDIEADPVTP